MSYENEINKKINKNEELPIKVDIPIAKFFWQVNPLTSSTVDNVPKYLKKIEVFKNFSENELRILSKYMHLRNFENKEVVFRQHDLGIGFYLIFNGNVDVIVEVNTENKEIEDNYVLSLEKYDYFGELALLQENSFRNATVISRGGVELLGIFKPDIESIIREHPVVAAKLLQSVSLIISNRLFSVTKEVRELNHKLAQLEKGNNAN